jgi:hypothetical protein
MIVKSVRKTLGNLIIVFSSYSTFLVQYHRELSQKLLFYCNSSFILVARVGWQRTAGHKGRPRGLLLGSPVIEVSRTTEVELRC